MKERAGSLKRFKNQYTIKQTYQKREVEDPNS
jgi:hypothetical protein